MIALRYVRTAPCDGSDYGHGYHFQGCLFGIYVDGNAIRIRKGNFTTIFSREIVVVEIKFNTLIAAGVYVVAAYILPMLVQLILIEIVLPLIGDRIPVGQGIRKGILHRCRALRDAHHLALRLCSDDRHINE